MLRQRLKTECLKQTDFAVVYMLGVCISLSRVDGGISNNDFVLELMSSLTCQTIDRPSQTDMSTMGAAFLAGLSAGKLRYVRSF